MSILRFTDNFFVMSILMLPLSVLAEDTDIFLTNPNVATGRANILLVLDNAASNNSSVTLLDGSPGNKLEMLRQVLNNIIDPMRSPYFPACNSSVTPRVPVDCVTREEVYDLLKGVNVGLMIANHSPGSGSGGYVRYHIRPMNEPDNQAALLAKINSSIPPANNAPYAKSMHEAYLYYGGKSAAYVGFDSNDFDVAAKNGSGYHSPITDSCQKNYIIFVGNGGPDSGEEKDTAKLLGGVGTTAVVPSGVLTTDPVPFAPSNYTSSWFDEYARTLFKRDVGSIAGFQNIITYTVAVQNPDDNSYSNPPVISSRRLLESAATLGGGKYFEAANGQAAMRVFVDAIRGMQDVNSVFSSSTLPVSVNVRGEFLNQVYMGQFRPDAEAKPRWPGNLKQYKIAVDVNGNPVLADRSGAAVEDKDKGFLLPDKTSFWTTASSYWAFNPLGSPLSASDAPDGATVEKGGAAQRLRTEYAASQAARKLYTCNGTCVTGGALSAALFHNDNTVGVTAGILSAADEAERTAIINWVRGADNIDNEDANGVATDVRAYIHGDLIHSRPAVVNYNRTPGDRDIMVYYGANDGIFHAVKGGQADEDGLEKWGMIFPEHLGSLKRLRINSPAISTTAPKPYFADGAASIYQKDANGDGKVVAADGDKVYLYVGMRRGGRFAYALDVSDPDAPKFLWKIDNAMSDFSELGQTWSAMRPANISAVANDPVVIFGAGYDPQNEDVMPAGSNDKGRGIFVVNGRTGVRVKHILPAGMGSVAADLSVIDRDNDGLFDRIYAVDTKGNIWRVDIGDADPNKWQSYKLASLAGGGTNARKFLNKPDVVLGDDFDVVLVGAGDREHPFDTSIANRFYMLKDDNTGLAGGLLCETAGAPPVARTCVESDLVNMTTSTDPLPLDARGWFITLDSGEKVVSSSETRDGTTFFSTNRPLPPTAGSCASDLGGARLYAVGYETGKASLDLNADGVINEFDLYLEPPGGGFPPAPVYTNIPGIPGAICFGTHCIALPPGTSSTERYRTHWYIEQ